MARSGTNWSTALPAAYTHLPVAGHRSPVTALIPSAVNAVLVTPNKAPHHLTPLSLVPGQAPAFGTGHGASLLAMIFFSWRALFRSAHLLVAVATFLEALLSLLVVFSDTFPAQHCLH